MKFGRMAYNVKIPIPFEDEIDRFDRTHTSSKRIEKIDIPQNILRKSFEISQ